VLHKGRLAPGDVEARPGLQVTTPLRTLLNVADSPLSQEHLNAAVREALERGLVRRRHLEGAAPPGSGAGRIRRRRRSMTGPYDTPQAFRAALQARLRNVAHPKEKGQVL